MSDVPTPTARLPRQVQPLGWLIAWYVAQAEAEQEAQEDEEAQETEEEEEFRADQARLLKKARHGGA